MSHGSTLAYGNAAERVRQPPAPSGAEQLVSQPFASGILPFVKLAAEDGPPVS
jgi:hypothetical protein